VKALMLVMVSSLAQADPAEPVNSVRLEGGLGGPNGYGAIRYVRRLGDIATIEPAIGYGATGLGGGAIVALQLRQAGDTQQPLKTRKLGWRLYAGASFAKTLRDSERSTDVPTGTYVWADFGAYWHGRLTSRVQLVVGVNLGILVSSPDREMIGEGDDDFEVVGLFGAPSWWIKQGFAPGFWIGLQL
jgi:hypothetical protein